MAVGQRVSLLVAPLLAALLAAGADTDVMLPKERRTSLRFTSPHAGVDRRLLKLLNAYGSLDKDIYQFGVYTGNGLKKIAAGVKNFGHLYGFDSFHGIPDQSNDETVSWTNAKGNPKKDFLKGGYSAAEAVQKYNLTELMRFVANNVNRKQNLTLLPGYFSDSLTPTLVNKHRFQQALHVDVDVDIYSSTFECLDWMLSNRLIVPSTFVRYDDWPYKNASHGPASGTNFYGQARAHYELTIKYSVRWRHVAKNTFQVVGIGSRDCDPKLCGKDSPAGVIGLPLIIASESELRIHVPKEAELAKLAGSSLMRTPGARS